MPLVERVLDRSSSFVTAETKTAIGAGARDLLASIKSIEGSAAQSRLKEGLDVTRVRACVPGVAWRGAFVKRRVRGQSRVVSNSGFRFVPPPPPRRFVFTLPPPPTMQ